MALLPPFHYDKSFTLAELETTCNNDELNEGGELQSLQAVIDTNGDEVTEALYDDEQTANLGNLTIKKGSGGSAFDGTAFISGKDTDVAVSR